MHVVASSLNEFIIALDMTLPHHNLLCVMGMNVCAISLLCGFFLVALIYMVMTQLDERSFFYAQNTFPFAMPLWRMTQAQSQPIGTNYMSRALSVRRVRRMDQLNVHHKNVLTELVCLWLWNGFECQACPSVEPQ